MRMVSMLPALVAAGLLLGAPAAKAEINYPWCAQYGDDSGARNCGFSSLEQCRAAISGNGGYCNTNPMYRETTGSTTPVAPVQRQPVSGRPAR